jgi:hypothetical protein
MINGRKNLSGKEKMKKYKLIIKGIEEVNFKKYVKKGEKNLVRRLCSNVDKERIGYKRDGVKEIKNKKWLKGINWEEIRKKRIKENIIKYINGKKDIRNFENFKKEKSVKKDENYGWEKEL